MESGTGGARSAEPERACASECEGICGGVAVLGVQERGIVEWDSALFLVSGWTESASEVGAAGGAEATAFRSATL